MMTPQRAKNMFAVLLLMAGVLGLAALPNPMPRPIGEGDWRGYWSATYLLAHRENFSDAQRIMQVQQTWTGWTGDYPIVTWNPPWLFIFLLPFGMAPYVQAAWWWLLTNIVIVIASAAMLWRQSAVAETVRQKIWLPVAIAFVYAITLIALVAGQVNTLVLLGLAAGLFFAARENWTTAGALLVLTTVKPQLVYLTLPMVLLDFVYKRRWRALAGFGGALAVLLGGVFALRPTFIAEYFALSGGGNLLAWQNPTLTSFLDNQLGWHWARFSGAAILIGALIVQWRWGRAWQMRQLVDCTVLLSVMTTPFAWSYDYIVLLIPLLSLCAWLASAQVQKSMAVVLLAGLGCANGFLFYQRLVAENELSFFWVPIFAATVYAFAVKNLRRGEAQR